MQSNCETDGQVNALPQSHISNTRGVDDSIKHDFAGEEKKDLHSFDREHTADRQSATFSYENFVKNKSKNEISASSMESLLQKRALIEAMMRQLDEQSEEETKEKADQNSLV